ncbi:protein-disulfide reductase DsbD [Aestuariirhabdus litorea]|uniref:Thiol:disulfide interchange protein DsbD n=1 Tax=Aestuariirhabdus litorea TaxID=2528527 RepID=A0A3P3VLM4_9GAMM|nr:protein-disulfide reductase DsbD [Aestuariirhabdus litorea]RRJ83635.1 protein-disulfide reductase DsbD [Aestuariirhabdus litorea]RWW96856.1 protein-disulfide reductase DsbD [Endozoicomonadaceae bacterium GTF-13]
MRTLTSLLILMTALLATPAYSAVFSNLFSDANSNASEFLPVEEAFQVDGSLDGELANIRFRVTEGHYLYNNRFKFVTVEGDSSLQPAQLPPGKPKYDQFQQQELEVYTSDVTIPLVIPGASDFLELDVTFQGCADAGLCYPPHTQRIALLNQPGSAQLADSSAAPRNAATEDQQFTRLLSDSSWLVIIGLFLIAGLGLTFTPCVLPMVPILSSLIVGNGQHPPSRGHTIAYSSAYVLGMALTFAIAGTLMGYFGAGLNLQAKLQSPWVLIPFAGLFVLLSLSMFGFYELQLPSALRNRVQSLNERSRGGSLGGALLMGVLSSLVVSPCVTAPLAGALVYISTTGDALLGGFALFALGLGMGIPLLILAVGGSSLLPKAGAWMESVKAVFGVMLLGVAIWMLERLLPGPVTLLLWATLLVVSAIFMGALRLDGQRGWPALWQGLGLIMLIYGGCLVIGAAQGNVDPLRPLQLNWSTASANTSNPGAPALEFRSVSSLPELQRAVDEARAQQMPVFVDFYADWCISCKITEREIFPQPAIYNQLTRFTLIRADVTDNQQAQQELLKAFKLFGPPAFLFYDRQGSELVHLRVQGEPSAESLRTTLQQALAES